MDRELISNQDLMVSNMLSIEAIIAILEKKGIAKREEIIEELNRAKVEIAKTVKKMGTENQWDKRWNNTK